MDSRYSTTHMYANTYECFFTMRSVVPANKIEVAIQVAFRNGKKHNSVRILAVEVQCWLCPHKRRTSNDHHHRMAVACLGLGRKKSCGHDAIQQWWQSTHIIVFVKHTLFAKPWPRGVKGQKMRGWYLLPVAVTINALPCALGLQQCPANVGGQDTSYRAPAISHSCCVNQARLENGLKKNMPLINTSHATSCTDTQMDQFHCTWVSARGFLHVGFCTWVCPIEKTTTLFSRKWHWNQQCISRHQWLKPTKHWMPHQTLALEAMCAAQSTRSNVSARRKNRMSHHMSSHGHAHTHAPTFFCNKLTLHACQGIFRFACQWTFHLKFKNTNLKAQLCSFKTFFQI